ncbi:MAG: NIPSNAP family protein [Alphaproteobacteria bacterium]
MITCFIEYEIDPASHDDFVTYAQNWGQAIPRCGADLIGYFAPHEGSSTLAYGVYSLESLAADPLGRENYAFAQQNRFIRRETRTFTKLVSAPHNPLVVAR